VEEEVKKYFTEVITVPISPTKGDIKVYLDARFGRDAESYAMDDDLRRDIMRIIPEMISEVCVAISDTSTIHAVAIC